MKQNVHKKHPVKHSKKNDITMASAIKNRNAMEETVMQFGKWSILSKLCGLRGITSCPAQLT